MGNGSPDNVLWPSITSRPLSDIRETTEPSLVASAMIPRRPNVSHLQKQYPPLSLRQQPSFVRTHDTPSPIGHSATPEASSCYIIPHASVPRRSSSQSHARKPSNARALSPPLLAADQGRREEATFTMLGGGHGIFPPAAHSQLRLNPLSSSHLRRVPSKTVMRRPHPIDILEHPVLRHARFKLEIMLSAPLFIGGATIEGRVKCVVDENDRARDRPSIALESLEIDLLGFESVESDQNAIFISLGLELIDGDNPPPTNMQRHPTQACRDGFVPLAASSFFLPFALKLPLDTGPAPFQSKHASVGFLLCATAIIRDTAKVYRVRVSEPVNVLPIHPPEAALASLPVPLSSSEELFIPGTRGDESVQLVATLARQVWLSGASVFADVHIANKSSRHITKLELTLEQNVLCFRHADTTSQDDRHHMSPRLFERKHTTQLAISVLRPNTSGWHGIAPYASETRTCELELPRGLASISNGKYFAVHFFLNVTAFVQSHKRVSVQLPVTLIHMNSIDVMPHAINRVAATMAEQVQQRQPQRQRSEQSTKSDVPRSMLEPGAAFAAVLRQSRDRQRAQRKDMQKLCQMVDTSPRKYPPMVSQRPLQDSRRPELLNAFGSPSTPRSTSSEDTNPHVKDAQPWSNRSDLAAYRNESVLLPWLSPRGIGSRIQERLRIRPSIESLQSRLLGKNHRSVKESIRGPRVPCVEVISPQVLGLREGRTEKAAQISRPHRTDRGAPDREGWI